ncbi:hypothetical protein GHT06_009391 [Daphnia sinensis]|uniref:Uncharacterized protein n=1 Tax=Daphnia sinensis TaxID=1820382 RepID=A0AAD5L5G1_9CRUS|nr:hypothetical protein GHT06_009391 [Daphnia sinensis]
MQIHAARWHTQMITVMDGHKNMNHVDDHCLDFQNVTIPSGSTYIPGSDPCVLCLCEHGKNLWCQAVRCAASEDCLFYTTGKSCCEFICMDRVVEVICGFCLLSLLMIGIFVYYLHRKNRKMATGTLLNKSDADVALVDHSSIYEKKVKI